MKKAVAQINEEFSKELIPHCAHLMWCPEGKMSCGAYPTRDDVKAYLDLARKEKTRCNDVKIYRF